MKEVTSVFCAICGAHCAALVTVEDGKIVKWERDKESGFDFHPCPSFKAQAWKEINEHPDRLKYPLKRAGARGEGKWQRVSWDEAFADIARKLTELKEKYGPECLGAGVGEPIGMEFVWIQRLMSAFSSPNVTTPFSLCGAAGFAASTAMWGSGFGVSPRAARREEADPLLIIWGSSSDKTAQRYDEVKEHADKGGKLVIIDPRKLRITRFADLWIKPRPGSDAALAMGMLKLIIEKKLYDEEFVSNWTQGFDEIRKEVSTFTLDDVERVTWVPKEQIQQVVQWIGEYKIAPSGGITFSQGHRNLQGIRAMNILRTIVDPKNIPGWGWSSERQFKQQRGGAMYLLDRFPRKVEGNVGAQYKYGLRTAYVPYLALVNAMLDGRLKAAIMVQCNPIISYPNSRKTYEAFKKLELLVSLEVFPTPTSSLADYVLPVATINECDTIRGSTGGDAFIAFPKIIDPPGEARSDVMIINGLAKKMGMGEYFFDSDIETLNYALQPGGITWEEFKKIRQNKTTWTAKKEEGSYFNTPSGKAEIYSPRAAETLGIEPLPTWKHVVAYPETSEEYPLVMTSHMDQEFRLTGWKQIKYLRQCKPYPTVQLNPEVAQKIGARNGDWVWIETKLGRIMQQLVIDPDLDPRVVMTTFGWWFPEAGENTSFGWDKSNVNILLPDEPAEVATGSQDCRGFPCKVYKAELSEVGLPQFSQGAHA